MAKNDNWTCKDGTQIKMCKMTDSHLKNAIKLFEPYKDVSIEKWKLLMAEKERREDSTPDDPIESRFDILDI